MESNKITYFIAVLFEGAILPESYSVGSKTISVSYPPQLDKGVTKPVDLPAGSSTLFRVDWNDVKGSAVRKIRSDGFDRIEPLQEAIDAINSVIEAFKLVRVGHIDGMRLRSIGWADVVAHSVLIDDKCGNVSGRLIKTSEERTRDGGNDPHQTTELAKPYIATKTMTIARRFLRCFELNHRGFHSESLIVAHSILDDVTQKVVADLLRGKGLTQKDERALVLRGIKERRLETYLGPLLKMLYGNSLQEIWTDFPAALAWLNSKRNSIAHNGHECNLSEARLAIHASTRTVSILAHYKLVDAVFPRGMLRQARIEASWANPKPSWAPQSNDAVETDCFDPAADQTGCI